MKDYKRLTIKTDKGYLQPCQHCHKEARHLDCDIYDCAGVTIQRLGEIEDKIEQGRLIALPVKVGDIAYLVSKIQGIRMFEIAEIRVLIDEYTKMIQVRDIFGKWWSVNYDNVFLSKEEAGERLAGLRGGKT